MFPTAGLFQTIPCPAAQDGSCERPYCHFNHSLSSESQNPNSHSPEQSDPCVDTAPTSDTTPVYRPTPIRLLEQREHVDRPEVNGVGTSAVDRLPVYQPTPINELDRYAPTAIPHVGFGAETEEQKPLFLTPSAPPTYSPVIKANHHLSKLSMQPPTISSCPSPFVYQPSPAYPPMIESAPSLSDDEPEPTVGVNSSPTGSSSPMLASGRGSYIKRKRKGTQDSTTKQLKETATTDESKSNVGEVSVVQEEFTEDLNQLDNSALSKRQKLLSLYNDLYGDKSGPARNPKVTSPSSSTASRVSPIPPYSGSIPAKSVKKSESPIPGQGNPVSAPVDVPRPRMPLRKSDKIPMPIRTRYLDQFIEECLHIYESPQDAYDRALNDEQACHDKSASRMAYLNAVIQRLKSLKTEKIEVLDKGMRKPVSHAPGRPLIAKTYKIRQEIDDPQKSENEELEKVVQGPLLHQHLSSYVLNEDQLVDNGYPRVDRSPNAPLGKATIIVPDDKDAIYSSCPKDERICCRCGARFAVDEYGNALVSQKCLYHWSRPVKRRMPGAGVDLRYLCCQAEVGQPGCQLCPNGHVHESNKWFDCDGFVTTLPPLVPIHSSTTNSPDKSLSNTVNVYAIDCEMVYTTEGCELGRVTIVDQKNRPILDTVVKPLGTLIDCNTRFSGLLPEQLENAEMRITDVQAKLLHLVDSETILIGHSLESDLVALKLIHSKVVDTSVVFPHREGPPKKRALRNLVSDYLHRYIQQDDTGHNSLEDAIACMELVQYQVKEDLRRGKWSV